MTTYPEHDKLNLVKGESQSIGAFLDWLLNGREDLIYLAQYDNDDKLYQLNFNIQDLLAEYFQIDRKKLESEKLSMLEEIRSGKPIKWKKEML